jgi:hypothetical protein
MIGGEMKNVIIAIIGVTALAFIIGLSRTPKDMDVVNSIISGSDDLYSLSVSVILYDNVRDKESCAKEIINKLIANDFATIMFSWEERGYPYSISATVYKNDRKFERGEAEFSFDYVAKDGFKATYSVVDSPEKFELIIK